MIAIVGFRFLNVTKNIVALYFATDWFICMCIDMLTTAWSQRIHVTDSMHLTVSYSKAELAQSKCAEIAQKVANTGEVRRFRGGGVRVVM